MEAALESKDTELGRSGLSGLHGRLKLLLGEFRPASAAAVHEALEHELDGVLVRAGAAHHGKDLVQPTRRHRQEDVAKLSDHGLFRKPT